MRKNGPFSTSFRPTNLLFTLATLITSVLRFSTNLSTILNRHPHSTQTPTNKYLSIRYLPQIYTYTHTTTMLRQIATTAPRATSRLLTTSVRPSNTLLRSTLPSTSSVVSSRRSYHEKVLDHYSNPRNVGSMNKSDGDVGTGLVGAPACGDVMKLQIKVDPKDQRITDVKFKTFGCGSAIASSSYLTELVRGMTLEDAAKIRNTQIAKELCLPPVKCRSE